MNGYWEIDYITQKGETFKPKQSSQLYDYYLLNPPKGIQKKLAPLFDGSFETSASTLEFEIIQKDQKVVLRYKTPWETWEKIVELLNPEKLVLFHEEKKYYYKRPLLFLNSQTNE